MQLDRVIAVRNDKTIYRDGDRCVKVFARTAGRSAVLAEATAQACAAEAGICVPAPIEVIAVDGRPAIVSAYVAGQSLAEAMAADPASHAAYLARLVEAQLALHAIDCPRLPDQRRLLACRIARAPLPELLRDDLLRRAETLLIGDAFCHGELTPDNLILTADGRLCILDWGHAACGHAAADAAVTYLSLLLADAPADAAAYGKLFCARAGIDEAELRCRLPLAAAARLAAAPRREHSRLCAIAGGHDPI